MNLPSLLKYPWSLKNCPLLPEKHVCFKHIFLNGRRRTLLGQSTAVQISADRVVREEESSVVCTSLAPRRHWLSWRPDRSRCSPIIARREDTVDRWNAFNGWSWAGVCAFKLHQGVNLPSDCGLSHLTFIAVLKYYASSTLLSNLHSTINLMLTRKKEETWFHRDKIKLFNEIKPKSRPKIGDGAYGAI